MQFLSSEIPGNELTARECELLGLDPTMRVRGRPWLWTDKEVLMATRMYVSKASEAQQGAVVNPDGTPTNRTLQFFGRFDLIDQFDAMRQFAYALPREAKLWHTGGNVWVVRWVIEQAWGVDKWVDVVEMMASPSGDDGEWLASIEVYDHLSGERIDGWNAASSIPRESIEDAVTFALDLQEWFETTGTVTTKDEILGLVELSQF